MNWLLPKLTHFVSKSQELLFVFSLTWGLSLAALFHLVGLSVEIGALLAGVAVSGLPFADEMSSRLRPLRDFFIILFFIYLGSSMTFGSIGNLIIPVVVLSLFVLIGNPVIVIIITNLLGYHKKTSFMAGLTVAQISEFSLNFSNFGNEAGAFIGRNVDDDYFSWSRHHCWLNLSNIVFGPNLSTSRSLADIFGTQKTQPFRKKQTRTIGSNAFRL